MSVVEIRVYFAEDVKTPAKIKNNSSFAKN